ncbi:hypothetical protein BST11_03810 [Mycobacterium alsense]|uniref:Mce protein n=1 Tax=Mycobacterium alsense TaxID=324058 RepID=A0AA41XKK7_9MYCO|nr:hypothetical protein [Mycobacterium alsense]MCV7377765.1 hypothetical protein [Mycobacterium alsense]OQZ93117.1 hypothetical protein BST11_03810 [Mycobacterium alsense]
MPPRELPTEALDVSGGLAQAQARAEAARARADLLRRQAEAASTDRHARVGGGQTEKETAPARRWRARRPGRKALAVTGAVVVICASLAGSGYLVWHHRGVEQQRQRTAEFTAAARNGIVAMMSIDPARAREDLQRFADDTTGIFKASFLMGAEDLVKAIEQSKISSKATVQAAAVQSMTQDAAVVLVAAKTEVTKPGDAKPDTRNLRAVVSIQRDGGQLKVSRVEFVP